MLVNLIIWIIVGGIAGWLASIVMKTNRSQGLVEDVIIGIVGAFIGGFVFDILNIGGDVDGLNIGSILVAFVGSVILIFILKKLR